MQNKGTDCYTQFKDHLPTLKRQRKIFVMIQRSGPATLFCSFSAAETKWIHLLKMLGKLVDTKDYTNEQLENMTLEDNCRLIQSDPVTCACQFDYQVQTFIRDFLLSDCAPLRQVADWFCRVEIQQHSSPHIHNYADMDKGCPKIWSSF